MSVSDQVASQDQPERALALADAIAKLVAILPGVKAAIERKPPVDRMAFRLDEVADSIGMSRRAIERERSAGRFPLPDLHIGKAPLWRPQTISTWLDSQKGGRR
jgi:predicted DNA-binding transcriptional regulator AlpA